MAKPLVTFGSPEAAVIVPLRAVYVGRPEAYIPPATYTIDGRVIQAVSTSYPSWSLTGNETAVQVELEVGDTSDYPVTERARVRVNCNAAKGHRTNVLDLASLTLGLASRIQSAEVAGVRVLQGRSDVIEDPDTGNLMCWFAIGVDLKASLLAS